MHGPSTASHERDGERGGGYMLAVLMLAYAFSFLDRQILSLLVGPIKRDLGINDTQLSILQGLAFALLLGVCGLPIGRLIDRERRVPLVAAGIAVWSCMTAACGLAQSYAALMLCRMGVGAGEATLTPAAYSLLADRFAPRRLGLALGLYSIGVYVGGGLALVLGALLIGRLEGATLRLPLAGALHGWQLVFIAVGLPGLLVALWAATLREPPRRGAAPAPPTLAELHDYFRTHARSLLTLTLCMSFAAMMNYSCNAWMPSVLMRSFGWSAAEAGRAFGVLVMLSGAAGVICGGLAGDTLVARGRHDGRLRVMLGAALAAAPFIALAPIAGGPYTCLLLLAPACFFVTMVIGCGPAALQEIVPNRMRGTASALAVLIVNLIGLGIGPTFVAALSDYGFGDEQRIGAALAVCAPPMLLLSALLAHLGLRAFARPAAIAAAARACP